MSSDRITEALFFAGFLAYAHVGIDTRLIHHWQGPAFYFTSEYVRGFLSYPGGLAAYAYALIAQSFTVRFAGAIALTAMGALVTAVTARYLRGWARFVPAALLLFSWSVYYDRTPTALALLTGLGAAGLFRKLGNAPFWLRLGILIPTYYAGGMALVFATVLIAGAEIGHRRYWNGAAATLAGAALPVAAEATRLASSLGSGRGWFTDADPRKTAIWWSLYVFYLGASFARTRARTSIQEARPARRRWQTLAASSAALACLGVSATAAYRTNARDRELAGLDYHVQQENWSEALAAASRLDSADFNSLTRYEVNLALHETHRLGDEMFRYPQSGSTLPRLRTETFLPYMLRVTDLLLRLGRVNDAEHFGYETVILGQADARVRRAMAEIAMVKGETEAARKYLRLLSTEASSRGWARARLGAFNDDPQGAADPRLQELRRRMLRTDDTIPVWQNPEQPDADVNRLLLDQLEQDPSNRMAFEFLMGNYLLARDLRSARELMPRIRQISGPGYQTADGQRRTPRHYQEAMAMYADGSGERVAIEGLEIEAETLNRMAVFKRVMSQSPGRDAAMQAAWSRFRDSYFFYFVFGPGDYR